MSELKENIKNVLINELAQMLALPKEHIDADKPLIEYGLDSVQAVSLTGIISEELKIEVDPALMWEYPTLNAICKFLSDAYQAQQKNSSH